MITVSPKRQSVSVGGQAVFVCEVTQGLSIVSDLEWMPVPANAIQVLDLQAGTVTLTIDDARNSQQFTCQATSTVASASDTVHLDVTRKYHCLLRRPWN